MPIASSRTISEINLTCGGLFGYCSSNTIVSRNVPSSNGVSPGPIITAFLGSCESLLLRVARGSPAYHTITLSGVGDAETPAGGSCCIRCIASVWSLPSAIP